MAAGWAVTGGATAGIGLTLLVAGLRPSRPQLTATLQRLDAPAPRWPTATRPGTSTVAALVAAVTRWALTVSPFRLPVADLAVVGRSVEAHMTRKLAMAVYGLVLPTILTALVTLVGVPLPVVVPAGVALAMAAGFFWLPDLLIVSEAAEIRVAFRRDVGAYLDLVALERAADGGPADALHRAAQVGGSRGFTTIADTLNRSRLSGVAPWQALAELATQVGVTELRDLADIVTVAGDDGAAVYDTLVAKAAGMRAATLAELEAAANAASERMTLPAVLLGFAFLLLVCYPALARVLA